MDWDRKDTHCVRGILKFFGRNPEDEETARNLNLDFVDVNGVLYLKDPKTGKKIKPEKGVSITEAAKKLKGN